MLRTNFDSAWSVSKVGRFANPQDNVPQLVDLPHDYSIGTDCSANNVTGSANGYYDGYAVSYVKYLDAPEEWSGQHIFLDIDGAYMNSEVYINGNTVAHRPYGYAPYQAELTDYIKFGEENEIKVIVNNSAVPNTRWYSGTGLYRHVDLLRCGDISIAPWGVYARTESVTDGDATVVVEVNVKNSTGRKQYPTVFVEICDESEVTVASGHFRVAVEPSSENKGFVRMLVENAKLWDIDCPELYKIKATVFDGDCEADTDEAIFGIRTISVDVKRGFRLNGKTIKLKGGCIHHDNGILGSAAFDDADYRRVKLHKDNGFNALRSAHNPPSRGLLEACDKLGMLFMDETFDMWNEGKNINDYHLYFAQWWEKDVDAMVLRDRNHPSVIMWSLGNEIPEHGGRSDGWLWSQKIAARIRMNDNTRFITSAVNNVEPYGKENLELMKKQGGFSFTGPVMQQFNHDNFSDMTDGYTAPLDIVGYNYVDYLYDEQSERYKNRVMCGHESFPMSADLLWQEVLSRPNLIGDFTWTSFDYIGEAGIGKVDYVDGDEDSISPMSAFSSAYPWRLANDADFDICGFDKPQLHYRKIVWGSDETYIAVRNPEDFGKAEVVSQWGWPGVRHSWNWAEASVGKSVSLDVYSAADEVELIVNGKSIGRKPAGKDNRFTAKFITEYVPGTVAAVSYIDGKEISRDTVVTAGAPEKIILVPEKTVAAADGQSLNFVRVAVVDKDGKRVPGSCVKLCAVIDGDAVLQAFGSANPKATENYTSGEFTSFDGLALAIIRSGKTAGRVKLVIKSCFADAEYEYEIK